MDNEIDYNETLGNIRIMQELGLLPTIEEMRHIVTVLRLERSLELSRSE